MSDVTELLLKKYYGFGANPKDGKFLSSHEATYDPCKFDVKSDSLDDAEPGSVDGATTKGSCSMNTKDQLEISSSFATTVDGMVCSSRAFVHADLSEEEDESGVYEYATPLNLIADKNDKDKVDKVSESKDPSTPRNENINRIEESVNVNDLAIASNNDAASENASEISSVATSKKSKRKSCSVDSMCISRICQAPQKLPSCNGIFLDLTKLCLTQFPVDVIADAPNLRMLYLENNSLRTLPDGLFSRLKLLQWLDIRNNRLKGLPGNIKGHPCLETILLNGNLFEELPLELCQLPNLKELQASRNPLVFPPANILALGFAATLNFLRKEWNKIHPEEPIEHTDRERKPGPSMILCSDPPVLKTLSRGSRVFGSSSTGHVNQETKKLSVRQKSLSYKPRNRCEKRGTDEELEMRLRWLTKVKDMLTEQTIALQKIKDRDALNDWRRDRRSYEKSMSRAASRTEEAIPFAIDLENIGSAVNNRWKMPLGRSKPRKQLPGWTTNINEKMANLCESLSQLEKSRKSETLSLESEQKLLENEIKKLCDVKEEIHNLRRYNDATTASFEGSEFLKETRQYKPPPSIII